MEKKIGRPKQTVKRNIEVKFLVTEEEYEILSSLVNKYHGDKSKFIRHVLLHPHLTDFLNDFRDGEMSAAVLGFAFVAKKVFSSIKNCK